MKLQKTQIHIALLDEGTSTWKTVEAIEVESGFYKIVSVNEEPDDELWEYQTGDVVRCKKKKFSDGTIGLVATEGVDNVT